MKSIFLDCFNASNNDNVNVTFKFNCCNKKKVNVDIPKDMEKKLMVLIQNKETLEIILKNIDKFMVEV